MNNRVRSQAGLSLLEVLIAMAIMVFISFAIYQATTETYKLRDVLSVEGDFYNGIRLSMGLVERDLEMTYSPHLMVPQAAPSGAPSGAGTPRAVAQGPSPGMQAVMQSDAGRTSAFWLPAVDESGIRPSRFVGTGTKMTFVSASHDRVYKDKPESAIHKVTYEIRRDDYRDPLIETADLQALVRTEVVNAFDDDERRDKAFSKSYTILRGIKKMQFRYWRKDKERWESSWDNDREEFRNRYPDRVEVLVEVLGPYRLSFEGQYWFRTEVPVNGLDPKS